MTLMPGDGTCQLHITVPWRGQCHRRHPAPFHVRQLFHLRDSAVHGLPALVETTVARRDSADKEDKQGHQGLQDKKMNAEAIASAFIFY
jgi:hypothetical protein